SLPFLPSEFVKRPAPKDIITEKQSASGKMGPRRRVFKILVLKRMQTIVKENVNVREFFVETRKPLLAISQMSRCLSLKWSGISHPGAQPGGKVVSPIASVDPWTACVAVRSIETSNPLSLS